MKKKFLSLVLLAALILSSCATSMYPAKESPEDCLLIIPTEFVQGPNTEKARTYYLNFSNRTSGVPITGKRYSSIRLLQEEGGNKIESVTSRVTHANYRGEPSTDEFTIDLPYEAGKVIISDFKVVHSIEMTKARQVTSRYDFIDLTEQEKAEILEDLKADGMLETWY